MNAIKFLNESSKSFLITTGLVLIATLGIVDYLSGPDVSFFILNIAPVFIAAWFVGRAAGLWMSAVSALSWFIVAELSSDHFSSRAVPYWNSLVRFGFMVIFTFMISALKRAHDREREIARTDYLTGTVNGRYFAELASNEMNRAERHGRPFTVAYMDIDDFKIVNDMQGHSAGDLLLRTSAETMRKGVRSFDVVARLGGDEFAILMPETDAKAAEVVVRRLRRSLLETARENGWPVTYSIGVVTWEIPPASVDELLGAADETMYAAKRNGKNRIRHKICGATANAA